MLLPDKRVEFVDESEVQSLRKDVIDTLKAFSALACELANNNETIATDIFADLISIIYKLPMVISYVPSNRLSTPHEYFFTYIVYRHMADSIPVNDIVSLLKKLEEQRKAMEEVLGYAKTLRRIYEKLLHVPADTRPGYNFTSLASHLQLSSILVWLLQKGSVDLNYLRIAALLHDLGKLFNPTQHVIESIKILNEVIEGAECLKSNLTRVKSLVEQHHAPLETILNDADRLAAATDRFSEIVKGAINNTKIRECYNWCYGKDAKTKECMECLEKYGKETYSEESKGLYEVIYSEINKAFNGQKTEGNPIGYLVYVDFPGIQRFITSFPKLREMSFASFLVDFVTSVYSFIALDQAYYEKTGKKSRIPVEALLSGYGGHSYIIVRSDFGSKDDVKTILGSTSSSALSKLDIRLDVKVVDFAYEKYVRNYKEIYDEMKSKSYERYLISGDGKIYSYGLHRVCDNCGVRPAVDVVEDEYLCETCKLVRELSRDRGFMAKLKSTYYLVEEGKESNAPISPQEHIKFDPKDNETFSKYAMEIIAGYRNISDTKYVAFIKADGNNAGKIFGNTITFSEYVDKSFRLDYGVKKMFYDTLLDILRASGDESVKKDLVSRILLGVLYLGGDDITILAPSAIAVPFATKMFKRSLEYTGFTFKVGIISVKPDHPVQFAYGAVNTLMEESKIQTTVPSGKSSIGVLVFSSTLASEGVVKNDLENYRKKEESLLVVSNDVDDIEKFLKIMELDDFGKLVELYGNPEEGRKIIRDKIRPLENFVNYADTHEFYNTLAYILRAKARSDKGSLIRNLADLILKGRDNNFVFPLYDYYFILKTIRVGM
ncbi:metal dependent phosphohydrolase [Sulfolobus islandicus M.16.27]|uniref:Metal dependent phosphohydrolase n=1 Tax=Saccharolobus islandicus (strain M.16.27) TaxID=427318 RepID=C3N4E4_SACI3|nr:metal dependent phosphohydrolase [Sulfolobus islandicus M.16.27]